MTLASEHPQEYPQGTAPISSAEIDELALEVAGWRVEGSRLTREFAYKDFQQAFSFVARVALLAEAEGHHPDITISWNHVGLSFWTHTADGLTRNDFMMAAKIDRFD